MLPLLRVLLVILLCLFLICLFGLAFVCRLLLSFDVVQELRRSMSIVIGSQ